MALDLILFAACLLVGLRLQRRARSDALRARIWTANYVLLIPLAACYAFLSIELDRQLLAIIGCAVASWWLIVLLAGVYARIASGERSLRGALWLIGAFPNTGFIGFPLAHLAFGTEGLRLAIIYDQVSLVVPAIVVSTIIAQRHAASDADADGDASVPAIARRGIRRELMTSTPLWTVIVLLLLRTTILREPIELELLGSFVAFVVGPVGFLLLGLSLPLTGFSHGHRELTLTAGAALVRIAAAPALLWLVARSVGVELPNALLLIAAMPTAFHTLVIARIHGLEVAVVRLGLLMTSIVVVAVTVAYVVAFGAPAV